MMAHIEMSTNMAAGNQQKHHRVLLQKREPISQRTQQQHNNNNTFICLVHTYADIVREKKKNIFVCT